jgi:hypothetical protein
MPVPPGIFETLICGVLTSSAIEAFLPHATTFEYNEVVAESVKSMPTPSKR